MTGLLASLLVFSGCGKAVEDSVSAVTSLGETSGSAQTAELEILENLPAGTLVFAGKNTTGLQSKADIILSLKDYLPEEMKAELDKNFSEGLQKEFITAYLLKGINSTVVIRPKKEEILFAAMATNPNAIAQENICGEVKISISKERIQKIITELQKNEKISSEITDEGSEYIQKFTKDPDALMQEFSDKLKAESDYKTFQKYAEFSFSTDEKNIIAEISTNACDEADKTILEKLHREVNAQDTMSSFISFDRAFLNPFLAKGNLATAQIAMAEGEKQLYAEIEKKGFDVEKIKQLKSEILDPWGRTNFSKMWGSFEKVSYVSGMVNGNLMDRESEVMVKFSDEEMAKLFAEIQEGKIPANKMWLDDGAKMTAKVSRSGGTVYDYLKLENTEYPSVLGQVGGNPFMLLTGITVVGIIETGATALYAGAQKKARDAVKRNDEQMIKSGLVYAYSDEGVYPENLETLVEKGYIDTLPEGFMYIPSDDKKSYTLNRIVK